MRGDVYSSPSVVTGSTSVDSTNGRSKIFGGGGKSRKFQKTQLEFATLATIYIAFTLYLQLLT